MLQHLKTSCSARFFSLESELSDKRVRQFFRRISKRPHYKQRGSREFRVAVEDGNRSAKMSGAVYLVEQEPTFLEGSRLIERKGAFVMLVEYGEYLAVFGRNVGDVTALLPFPTKPLAHDVVTRVFADTSTAYEALNSHNMSISSAEIRSRSVEAADLRGLLSNLDTRRAVIRRLRYRAAGGRQISSVPRVSRIGETSARLDRSGLVRWALDVIDAVGRVGEEAIPFLASFPTPVRFDELPATVEEAGLLLDLHPLRTALLEGAILDAQPKGAEEPLRLSDECVRALLRSLSRVFVVSKEDSLLEARSAEGVQATIRKNMSSYGLGLDALKDLRVHIDDGGRRATLGQWLVQNRCLIVTYSDPSYAYLDGEVFRDTQLAAGADLVLNMMETDWPLATSENEKGLLADQSGFAATSLFGITESQEGPISTAVICDDLGDEWADYITVNDQEGSRRLRFIHCKSKTGTGRSASDLHDILGQAIKNLGRLFTPQAEWERKVAGWEENPWKQFLARERPAGPTPDQPPLLDQLNAVAGDPRAVREVLVVVDFVSKQDISDAFDAVNDGTAVAPSVVQMLWFISGFASACLSQGARPVIKCQA